MAALILQFGKFGCFHFDGSLSTQAFKSSVSYPEKTEVLMETEREQRDRGGREERERTQREM